MQINVPRIFLVVILYLLTATSFTYAQDHISAFEVTHQARETERRAIIALNLGLDVAEAKKFWPRYDDYRAKIKATEKIRLELLQQLSKNLIDMKEKDADKIVSQALNLEVKNQAHKKKYIMGLRSVLGDAKIFRYYQIETKLDAVFKFGWTRKIPLTSLSH